MRSLWRTRWVVTALAATSCGVRAPVVEADLALIHVNVIPMTRDTLLADRTVLIRDGRIFDIVPDGAVTIAEGTTTVDGAGKYLMPGFVDGHAHVRAKGVMDLFLSQGFTTIRNMHGGLGDPLTWRRAIDAGEFVGPTLINASPVLAWNTPGFTMPGHQPITSMDTIRAFIQEIADSGYASIKTLKFPREAFDTLMAEARRVGLPVTGHSPMTSTGDPDQDLTFDEVLGSGLLVIEHLGEVINHGLGPGSSDTIASAELARRVGASGIAVTTTLGVTQTLTSALDLDSAYVTPELRARALRYGTEEDLAFLYQLPEIWRQNGFTGTDPSLLAAFVRQLQAEGVPLIVGTDGHNVLSPAGEAAVDEMLTLHAFGLTPFQALQALTSTPAAVLGAAGEWGTVEVGARADMVLLDGNPLMDPAAVRSVAGVALRGQWLDRSRLTVMRQAAEAQKGLACRRARCD